MKIQHFALGLGLTIISLASVAQQLTVATGAQGGTYSTMYREINGQCMNTLTLVEKNTSGSLENAELLLGNKVNVGFVQLDVLAYLQRTQDLSMVKTIFALHPEQVHIVTKNAVRKVGGTRIGSFSMGGKEVAWTSVEDLSGAKVGAVGGSIVTANVIRLQSEIPYQVVEFKSNDEMLAALNSNAIDAFLSVGGQPLGVIQGLDSSYKLLAFPDTIRERLKSLYTKASLNYNNLQASGIPSVSIDSLLVSRNYTTAKYITALSSLRICIVENLDELKDTTGTHPAWQRVEASNKGSWAWMDLK